MINEKFLINLQGKNYVTYEGLLDLAHQKGLKSIVVDILQIPSRENNMLAICRAVVSTEKDNFIDIGDASPQSVNSALIPHIIRMASTRAKARALRDLTNIGITAIEELSFEEEMIEEDASYQIEPPTRRQLETLKKLAEEANQHLDYESLTKKSAGNLIAKLIEDRKRR